MTCGCKKKMGGVPADGPGVLDEAFLKPGEVFRVSEAKYFGKFPEISGHTIYKIKEPKCVEALQGTAAMMDGVTKDGGVDKIKRGLVWCMKCGRSQEVNVAECIAEGWPQCCGETMWLDSPEERS